MWYLAHQGGWDELLTFLLPIVLVLVTWFLLERRSKRRNRGPSTQADEDATSGGDNPRDTEASVEDEPPGTLGTS